MNNNNFIEHFHNTAIKFSLKILERLKEVGLEDQFSSIDHICYRVKTIEDYEKWKGYLRAQGQLLSEAYINGRPIASFKLHNELIVTSFYKINVIELPAPKPGRECQEGFEHIELVSTSSLENLIEKFSTIKFNTDNFSAVVNRDISLSFEEGLVKFHEESLEDIIKKEQHLISKNTQKKLIIVDFDDTLINSKKDFLKAMHLALSQSLGITISYEDFVKKARPTFPEFFANFNIFSQKEIEDIILIFQEKWEQLKRPATTCVGIESVLSCLYFEGVEIIIWTARDKKTTCDFIDNSPLSAIIKDVYAYPNDKEQNKPLPPDELIALCQNAKAMLLGDSASDQQGALRLGIDFYQAAWVHQASLFGVEEKNLCTSPFNFLDRALEHFK